MKALAIIGAIVTAWISGVVLGDGNDDAKAVNGAVVLLVLACACGVAAWLL